MRSRVMISVVDRLTSRLRQRPDVDRRRGVYAPTWPDSPLDPVDCPTFSQPFSAVPSEVRAARAFVTALLGPDHPCHDDAILLTSELAGNVIRHAVRGEFAVSVALVPGGVKITVGDRGSAAIPRPRTAGDEDLSGRGLAMVDALAIRWGFQRTTGNTSVWFHLTEPVRADA
ncbi:ATP-binding protein [Sphaerisporangium rhizosphaerae]|uniref:ATP-binding protein n=1 Tax=Sphaerisporangium rhizosphaerae TaxID=2269375 RepID=A0ABW2PDR8_9ACTN